MLFDETGINVALMFHSVDSKGNNVNFNLD